MSLHVAIEGDAGHVVLVLAGELDAYTSPSFLSTFDIAMPAPARLSLDFGAVTLIDSAGIAALLRVSRRTTGRPTIVRIRPEIQRILAITELDREIDVPESNPPKGTPSHPGITDRD